MEGLIANYYEYHFLYINGIHHVEVEERPGRVPDEAVLPPRHRHGPGHGRDGRLRQPLAGVHAAGHRQPVHHAVRHRQRAGRLPRPVQRDEDDRPDPGPGAVQGPADVRGHRGRVGAAAVRRQPADGRRPGRPGPAARLRPVGRRRGAGARRGEHHRPVRAASATQDADAAGADQRDGRAAGGTRRRSR